MYRGPAIVDISKFRHILDDRCLKTVAIEATAASVVLVPLADPEPVIVVPEPEPVIVVPEPEPEPVIVVPEPMDVHDDSDGNQCRAPPSSPTFTKTIDVVPPATETIDEVRFVDFDTAHTDTGDANAESDNAAADADITIVKVDDADLTTSDTATAATTAATSQTPDLRNLDYLTVKQLQKRCKDLGIAIDGKKGALVERVRAHFGVASQQ